MSDTAKQAATEPTNIDPNEAVPRPERRGRKDKEQHREQQELRKKLRGPKSFQGLILK